VPRAIIVTIGLVICIKNILSKLYFII
jgi:hypothetical protein